MSENTTLVHTLYEAFGRRDLPFILKRMADDVVWICEGPPAVPFCGAFVGPAGVARFFETLATTQTGQNLKIEETYAAEDKVFSVGRYSCAVTATGKSFDSRVAHVFTIRDGKVSRLLDFIDTAQAAEAYAA